MSQSESVKEIATALVGFHKIVGKVVKDSTNPHFKNRYASLSAIIETVQEPLAANGLVIVQSPMDRNALVTTIYHQSGEWIQSCVEFVPRDDSPQSLGSAITYARRYALGAMLSLNIDEDDDATKASSGPPRQSQTVAKVALHSELDEAKKAKALAIELGDWLKSIGFKVDDMTKLRSMGGWTAIASDARSVGCKAAGEVFAYALEGVVPGEVDPFDDE